MNLSMTLRFEVGVTPNPYFGVAFEGRQCQTIARRLSSVVELLASYVPSEDAVAYSAACHTWAEHLPVLTRTSDSSTEDVTAFQSGTARFVDELCGAFPWLTVTRRGSRRGMGRVIMVSCLKQKLHVCWHYCKTKD